MMSLPHVTTCETNIGRKSRYYTTILRGKNDRSLWSVSTGEQFVGSFLTSTKIILHLECTRSQQVLMLAEASKLTCMPVDTVNLRNVSQY